MVLAGHLPYECSRLSLLQSLNITGNHFEGERRKRLQSHCSWWFFKGFLFPGSYWPLSMLHNLRYFQAVGVPGAADSQCAQPLLQSKQPLYSVFPSGTPSFCILKPGYPGHELLPQEAAATVATLCEFRSAAPRLWQMLNWQHYCSLAGFAKLSNDWKGVHEYLGNLVALSFRGLGYHGGIPDLLGSLTSLAELDLSRNYLEG